MPVPKFDITADEIEILVQNFYARIRSDAELGPIFIRAIGTSDAEWKSHEAKIASFWRNAIGLDRSFSGNPMLKHMANLEIQPEHFPLWLALFHETAQATISPSAAAGIGALADRIGQSLSWGLVQFRQPQMAPPNLT